MPLSLKIGRAAPHECLLIDRRRRGVTQEKEARARGIDYHAYCLMELGRVPVPSDQRPTLGSIETHERCYLLRRRLGLTLKQVASALRKSPMTVAQMESGERDCSPLVNLLVQMSSTNA